MLDRVKRRLNGEEADETLLNEYIDTVTDRLCIRLQTNALPTQFNSICADAVVKMYRRFYYEGISSDSDGGISTSFVDDVLAEYETEINRYRSKGAVRFI